MRSIRSKFHIWTRSNGNISVIVHLRVKENPSGSLFENGTGWIFCTRKFRVNISCYMAYMHSLCRYFLRDISFSLLLRSSKDSL